MHVDVMPTTHGHGIMPPCRPQQDISKAFNILSEFKASEYSYLSGNKDNQTLACVLYN